MQPIAAPDDCQNWLQALTAGCLPPVIWSAQSGIHCTIPQVTISATEAKAIARSVVFRKAGENTSMAEDLPDFFTEAFHASDSGTKSRMRNVNRAGAAPTIMTQRHESLVIGK